MGQEQEIPLKTITARIALALAAALFFAAPLAHAKRVALVIGNDNYTHVSRLQKAGNDANAMARELQAAGFRVLLHKDLNYRAMVKAVDTLTNSITGGDEVVVFFAGHGVQIRSGSYLLPVDIEATSESEVEKTSYALNDLMEQLAAAKASFSLVMIDACRDNPLKSKGRSVGGTRGLNAPEPPKGQMVVYSASRGQQALDRLNERDANANSVFTREFVARMRKPGVRVDEMVREVQDAVENLARTVSHEQRPAIYNEARGNFYFFGPTTVRVETPAAPSAATLTPEQREDRFWDDAKLAGNREAFEAYIDAYPKGRYAALARANVARLAQAPIAAAQTARDQRVAAAPQTADLRGEWKLDYTSSAGCVYEGSLTVSSRLSETEYRGQQVHKTCSGATITQDATITVTGENILVAMSNPRSSIGSSYSADNYYVKRAAGNTLAGFNRDAAGNGRDVRFVRQN
jgi:hypothetical protein